MNRYFSIFLLPILAFFSISCDRNLKKSVVKESLRINFPEEPSTMDPRKGGDIYSSAMHFLLFEGLTKISENSSYEPGLAYQIDLSDDKLTYTFHLRDALWSNQTSITADDFVYSWKTALDPTFPCPNANLFYPILNAEEAKKGQQPLDAVGIQALDRKTLQVTLKSPTPYFLNLISFCAFYPVSQKIVENNPKWADNISPEFVSNGPYQLTKWKHQDQLILKKNPHYWNKQSVCLKEIDISLITNENTALEMFNNKELDILGSPYTSIPIDAINNLINKTSLKTFPTGKTLFCSFNMLHPILKNEHIRKALSLSINRQAIIDALGMLNATAATNFVPPVLKKNSQVLFNEDIEEAKKHLAIGLKELELSIDDLKILSLIYHNQEHPRRICQIIQQQWMQHLGLSISLETLESRLFLDRINTKNFAIGQHYWIAQYDDPLSILDRFKKKSNPKNHCCWENQEYIDLLDLSAFASETQRDALLTKAEEIITEEMPITPIFHSSGIRIMQPYVKGVYTASLGSVHLEKVYFENEETVGIILKNH